MRRFCHGQKQTDFNMEKRSSIYQTIHRPFEWFAANDAVLCYLGSLFPVFFIPRDLIHTNHIAAFCLINGT